MYWAALPLKDTLRSYGDAYFANRVKSHSDRVSARSPGRPTREHRQSTKPRVRPLAPSPTGVLSLLHGWAEHRVPFSRSE